MGDGDVLITKQNGVYLWVCTRRPFDFCVTTKPYIALSSLIRVGHDFCDLWDSVQTSKVLPRAKVYDNRLKPLQWD